jgi:hypothetical protein
MKRLESVLPHTADVVDGAMRHVAEVPDRGAEEIDARGMYTTLTKYERYASHGFKPFEACALGRTSSGESRSGRRATRTQQVGMTFINQAAFWRGQPS